ncbi:MAG: 50S ribosomal protein L29 [Acidimicrobiales bacterium]|nr:MAG: 50S ribosomal protein L29 [Acidimicrobiales bacterium]
MGKKAKEIAALSDTELFDRLARAREELFRLRFQKATGELSNRSRIREVRKEVARCLTEIRKREIEAAEKLQVAEEVSHG